MRLRLLVIGVPALVFAIIAGLLPLTAVLGGLITTSTASSCVAAVPVSGELRTPMSGPYKVGRGFGPRFHPIYHVWKQHNGIDLTLHGGPGPILAVTGGTVTRAGMNGDAGLNVVLDHGNGVESLYMHLSSISVQVGQSVTTGQQLGIEGSTGASTSPHLHWAIRVNGAYTDPVAWAAGRGLAIDGTVPDAAAAAPTSSAAPSSATAVAGWSAAQVQVAAQLVKAGVDQGRDARTLALLVAAGMAESSLTNINRGDAVRADTIGVLQIGPEHGTYAQRMDPYWSAQNLLQRLDAIPGGYATLEPTIAINKAQRNKDPWAYAKFWDQAVAVVAHLQADSSLITALGNGGAGCTTAGGTTPAAPTSCEPTGLAVESGLRPTALGYLRCAVVAFPQVKSWGGYRSSATSIDKQGHPAGLAIDVMIPDYKSATGIALGDQVAEWTIQNREALGVKYLIWRQRQWTPARGWTNMSDRGGDTANHFDHVHVTLSAEPGTLG